MDVCASSSEEMRVVRQDRGRVSSSMSFDIEISPYLGISPAEHISRKSILSCDSISLRLILSDDGEYDS